jgi:hypothetical protein
MLLFHLYNDFYNWRKRQKTVRQAERQNAAACLRRQ